MKRILLIMLFLISFSGFLLFGGEADQPVASQTIQTMNRTFENRTRSDKVIKRFWQLEDIELNASSVMLIEAETGHLLYEENSDLSLPAASMSKMMTELIVLEAIDSGSLGWDTTVEISDYAYEISHHPGYATVHLQKDQSYTVEDLFHAMAIRSANGATIALAEATSGSEEAFIYQMNERANELGLDASSFVNSTGLDNHHLGHFFSVGSADDTNTMSARDLATLADHLITNHPRLLEITSEPYYFANEQEYFNTNGLLTDQTDYGLVDGLKTGYTDLAGYCFTGTVEQDGVRLISVVMGTESFTERFIETDKLYEHAFARLKEWTK